MTYDHSAGSRDVTPAQVAQVRAVLPLGRASAMTHEEIHGFTGLQGRTIRACMETLRGEGVPVVNDDSGVFLAEWADDLDGTIGRMWSQAVKMRDQARALRAVQQQLPRRQPRLLP